MATLEWDIDDKDELQVYTMYFFESRCRSENVNYLTIHQSSKATQTSSPAIDRGFIPIQLMFIYGL
jgi:hypothetical protein